MISRGLQKRSKPQAEIPGASLADMAFLLLIFFMVSTVLREFDVKVKYSLPSATQIEKIDNKRLVTYIWVGNDGRVQIDDNLVLVPEIQTIAGLKRQQIPNVIMSLRIDAGSKMGIVTDIQQQLRKGDALRINYSALQTL
jgi:biopolymer transport protein ExbD